MSSTQIWAGSGNAELLDFSVRAVRTDVVAVKRLQNHHGVLLGTLTEDVA